MNTTLKTTIIALAAIVLLISLAGCSEERHYDYTGEIDIITSIEILDVTAVSRNEDDLEYEVIREFDKSEWAEVLDDSAKMGRFFLYDPPRWREGPVLRIVFSEPVDGSIYVMMTKNTVVYAKQKDGGVELDSIYSACPNDQWQSFLEKYSDKGFDG